MPAQRNSPMTSAGEAVPFEPMSGALAQADIVVTSSASPEPVITPDDVRAALAQRPDRPLLIIDIAVPRDVDPAVGEIENVRLFDIDHLQALVTENKSARRQEVAKAEHIVDEGLEKFTDWVRARSVVPTVASLQARAEAVRTREVERTLKGTDDLTPAQRRRVEAMSKAIVKKMLHDPIARLKGADGERYAAAVRELFDLDGNEPTSRTRGLTCRARSSPALEAAGWRCDRRNSSSTHSASRILASTSKCAKIRTEGDRSDAPLSAIGGQGVFVKEIEAALLRSEIDFAVHSLKDLPPEIPEGLVLAAIPERGDPRDALVTRDGAKLDDLPSGAKIGTGSARRAVQLRALRRDIEPRRHPRQRRDAHPQGR